MGGSSLSLGAGGGAEGYRDGFCSAPGSNPLFPFAGGDGGSPGSPTVPVVDKGKVEGMGAPCAEVDGPLAGGKLGN